MSWRFLNNSLSPYLFALGLASCSRSSPDGADPPPPVRSQSWQETLARELSARGALDGDAAQIVRPVLTPMVLKSRYGRCLSINGDFTPDCLKVYIAKPKSAALTSGACGFAGEDTIFCDSGFLTGFLDESGALDDTRPRKAQYRAFQEWVLGHELGHADLKHPVSHFLVAPLPKTQKEAQDAQKREFEADRRYLEFGIGASSAELADVLQALFRVEYRKKYGAPTKSRPALAMEDDATLLYPYALDGSHPHMTIRCAEMLFIAAPHGPLRDDARFFIQHSAAPGLLREMSDGR